MRKRKIIHFSVAAVLISICSQVRATAQDVSANLAGTSWQLVKFQGGDDTTLTPDDRTKYTITVGVDGGVSARLDCNRGHGTWKSSGPNQLEFETMALTHAMCPARSLHDQIARNWPNVRSYALKDGHLYLSLLADGGTYEFEPAMAAMEGTGRSPHGAPRAPKSPADITARGPFAFSCTTKSGGTAGVLKVTYYNTDPGLALLEFQNAIRPAFQALSGSGAKYESKDVMFWEHQGEAMLRWSGVDCTCKPTPHK